MESSQTNQYLSFLSSGGKMAAKIAARDWSKTSIGPIQSWPQSLKTTLSILLSSRFPMFLFWGHELICFYNDAYRPSLGENGKHPWALGQKGADVWPEIWEDIQPLIDQVLSGGPASWSEDQLLPIYRNGKLEDVYWTFSYSPVYNELDKPAGVFVTCTETTAQVLNNRKLVKSENLFRNMAEDSGILIAMADYTGNAIFFNRAWAELTGHPIEDLLVYGWLELVHPDDKEEFLNIYKQAIEKKASWVSEFRIGNAQNGYSWVLAKGVPRHNKDGVFDGYISSSMDISERKEIELRIEESKQRLNLVMEASDIGTWEWDIVRDEISCSDSYLEIFGLVPDAPYNHRELINLIHKEDIDQRNQALNVSYLTGTLEFESRILLPWGEMRWIHVRGRLLRDHDGNPERLIGTIRNITREKTYQKELEDRETRFRLLADAMPQLVWVADENGFIRFYNKRISEFSGAMQLADGTWQWESMLHPDDLKATDKAWTGAIQEGKTYVVEHRMKTRDGTYRWYLTRAIPQKDEAGKISQWYGTATDIHEQKSFSEELERQVKERIRQLAENNLELEKMNKELQSFAYISSHDLQEPLRKIQTFAGWITTRESESLSENARDYFMRIQRSANRMQILIEDLLAYSRTTTSERKFEVRNLRMVLDEVREGLKEELRARNARIKSEGLCDLNIIPFQFRQLLYNLISNSLKFASEERPPLIEIKAEIVVDAQLINARLLSGTKYCHLSVIDNGVGFEPAYNEKVFELFQRLNGQQFKGTGLGLAIVRKIVENHNGYISGSGTPGAGARFDIYIPADLPEAPDVAQ